jgi:5-methylcytosine-specific restriction endonuclease McrA
MKQSSKRHCRYCDSEDHTIFYCPVKPKNLIKPIGGKYYQKMVKIRKEWYRQNLPDHSGYYYCAYCGKAITRAETELDHVLSRSRHPELRFELSNLKPSCHNCNVEKGSREKTAFYG